MAARSAQRADGTRGEPAAIKTVEQGAATSVWAAFVAAPAQIGGHYCEDCHVAGPAETGWSGGVRPWALDPQRARALWAKSEELVGECFPHA
jgi:hypothetical protein